jgi:hypothetical protein
MELRSDVTGTRPVAQGQSAQQVFPAGEFKQEVYARLMAIAIGRPLPAEITSRTLDGAAMVRVADTIVQMDLPSDAKVGDRVTLTLLAREPRLTFLFEREPAAHSLVSNTGRLIDTILRAVSQDPSMGALIGRNPLLSMPADAASLMPSSGLAPSLQSALTNLFSFSGLFYESHLAQWVAGQRPISDLMQHPQAKMHNEGAVRDQNQMNRLEILQERSWVQSLLSKLGAKMPAAGQQMPDRTELVIDRDAAHMIRLQLDVLENRRVFVQGEFWPGQEIEWEIEDDTSQQNREQGEPASQSWQSVLRMNLPLLGSVIATMRLTGEAVQVKLLATDEVTSSALREFGPELISALSEAGAKLDLFMVNDESA